MNLCDQPFALFPRRRAGPQRIGNALGAESVEEAQGWLKPKERMVVLHDRALIGLLASLPPVEAKG